MFVFVKPLCNSIAQGFLLLLLILPINSIGQINLVPNPSFEQHTNCNLTNGSIGLFAPPWFQPNIEPFGGGVMGGLTDYFNACDFVNGFGVPINYGGYQLAYSGNAYAGIEVFQNTILFNSRDYIEVKLLDSLKKNKKYCVSFYFSLPEILQYAVGNIGAYFSNDSLLYSSPTSENIPVVPQIENPSTNFLNDTLNWMLVQGEFIALGGEQFITIGNFRTNANTPFISMPGGGLTNDSYYYIDDVSVIECEYAQTLTSSLSIPNVFTPNGDNINDVFKPITKNIETLHCAIYNRWGIQVAELKEPNAAWDGRNTAGIQCTAGVYYYVLSAKGTDGKEYEEKGFVQLIR
jgi:gliding motility-associated-like protein